MTRAVFSVSTVVLLDEMRAGIIENPPVFRYANVRRTAASRLGACLAPALRRRNRRFHSGLRWQGPFSDRAARPIIAVEVTMMAQKASPTPAASPAATKSKKSRILIADDNGPNVELLEAYLSDLDCVIGVAVDGRDTLDKV